jgi:glycerol-3-phosphate acyltransferase PlsY
LTALACILGVAGHCVPSWLKVIGGKGVAVVWLVGQSATPALTALASILVVAGHCFPIWLKFNGGHGVATSLAVLEALDLRLGAVFVLFWLLTAFLAR